MKKLNIFLLLSFYYIFGGVINVPDDYSTISAAVENANSGDTIFVSSGTYNEILWFSKHVHIIGDENDHPSMDGDGLDGTMLWISDVFESDAVTIQNFKFTNGYSSMGSHLYISNSKVDFINVRITENSTSSSSGGGLNISGESEVGLHNSHILSNTAFRGGGIYIYSGGLGGGGCNHKASLSITNTEINHNSSSHDGGAIYIEDKCSDVSVHSSVILDNQSGNNGGGILNKGQLIIENSSVVSNNSEDSGSAFAIINHDTTHIINCTVTDNYGNSLVMLEEESGNDASEVLIDHSIFYTNHQESFYTVEGNVPVHVVNSLIEYYESISNNIGEWNVTGFVLDEDPQFSDEGDQFCPFPLSPNSPFINEGLGACNSSQSSSTGRLYVNSEIGDDENNGTEDFPLSSINRAIDLSVSGDTIYVSSGIYYENINYEGKDISIFGEDRETTILDGSDTGSVVMFHNQESRAAILDGFTIQNGFKDDFGSDWPYDYCGAGIFIADSSEPTIRNCIIRNNVSIDEGGGIGIYGGSPRLSNLILENNHANVGGGIMARGEDADSVFAYFDSLTVRYNTAHEGSGIYLGNANYYLSFITVYRNQGTEDDSQHGQGIYINESSGSIVNSTIANNLGEPNRQIRVDQSNLALVRSIIFDENFNLDGDGSIQYSTIDLDSDDTCRVWIDYSSIQGGWPCSDNEIEGNPLFCSSNEDDYTIAENSPCTPDALGEEFGVGAFGIGCEAIVPRGIYVDINGDDENNGSAESPVATFSKALNISSISDTIYFHPGVHVVGYTVLDQNNASVIIGLAGSGSTILDGSGNEFSTTPLNIYKSAYFGGLTFKSIVLQPTSGPGDDFIYLEDTEYLFNSENNTFLNSKISAQIYNGGNAPPLLVNNCTFKGPDSRLTMYEIFRAEIQNVTFDSTHNQISADIRELDLSNITVVNPLGGKFLDVMNMMGGGNSININGLNYLDTMPIQDEEDTSNVNLYDGPLFYLDHGSDAYFSNMDIVYNGNSTLFDFRSGHVYLSNSGVSMTKGKWFEAYQGSDIIMDNVKLLGQNTVGVIDNEGSYNFEINNSVLFSVDPMYMYDQYADSTIMNNTLNIVGPNAFQINNSIVWSGSESYSLSLEPAPTSNSVYFSIFTADDVTYDQLNGSQNFQLNPLFCNDSSAVVAENSPAIGNSEIGGNIGGVEIGCGPILFTPIITLLDQNFDEIGEFINMLEDDTLQLFYSVFDGNENDILSVTSQNTSSNVQIIHDEVDKNFMLIPSSNWYGIDTLHFIVSDGGLMDTSYHLLEVLNVNDPPDNFNLSQPMNGYQANIMSEDSTITFSWGESLDADGDSIKYDLHLEIEFFNQTFGIQRLNLNDTSVTINLLELIPLIDFLGLDQNPIMEWYVSSYDYEFRTQSDIFNLIVEYESVGDPYQLANIFLMEDFGDTTILALNDLYGEMGSDLFYDVSLSDQSLLDLSVDEGLVVFNSVENINGESEITIAVIEMDVVIHVDTAMVTVFPVNDAPTISTIEAQNMIEDGQLIVPLLATDVENSELEYVFSSDIDDIELSLNEMDLIISSSQDWNGEALITVSVSDGELMDDEEFLLTVTPVNDAPYFVSEMHASVGLELEFHLPLNPIDVDSEYLVATLTEGEQNPAWVMVTDHMLHGTPEMLGEYPVFLTLTDGQATIVDTFNLHAVNFKPEIVAIEDIPNDQGGRVYVGFTPSFLDNGEHSGQGYDVYRHDTVDGESGWVMVASGIAIGEEYYVFEATTLSDSSSGYDWATEFKVVAAMENGIFHSDPMVGYSVDNIAPGVPGGLMAVAMDDNIQLSWDMSTDEDFQYFVLEKATNMDFTEPEVIQTADTTYTDVNFTANETNYYRLVAVDHAGNASDYSEVVEAAVLSIDENMVPALFALHQNYPNPFNPTTQIKYDIAEDSFVSITIYDVMGRNIRTLMNVNQSAGYHSIQWDAKNDMGEGVSAGMYIYVIQAGEFRATKKMVLLK